MEWYMYLLILGGGILTGFINTLSGNGSVISLPLLIFVGLPANVANGTNRVGIMLQNLVGTVSFQQKKVLDVRGALILGIPAADPRSYPFGSLSAGCFRVDRPPDWVINPRRPGGFKA